MTKSSEVPAFVKEQLVEAQKRFVVIQGRGREDHQGVGGEGPASSRLTTAKRTKALGSEVRKKKRKRSRTALIQAAGVATQSQIKVLTRELSKLSKKVDALVEKKAANKTDARA